MSDLQAVTKDIKPMPCPLAIMMLLIAVLVMLKQEQG